MFEYIFGILIGLTQYFNERLLKSLKKYRIDLISFSAGLSSSYLFLLLLPEVYDGLLYLEQYMFLILFIGFISIHIAEKYIYKHVAKKRIRQDVRTVHHTTFFLYHFIVGLILVVFLRHSIREGLLFFIPVWFHTTFSSIAMIEFHEKIKRKITKLFLSFSTILGIAVALLIPIPAYIFYTVLALITGALTYLIVKDFTPRGKTGNLNMYILGVIAYSLIIILSRLI